MKQMIAMQTKAKRFLEGAHSEIANAANEATEDSLTRGSFSFNVGDASFEQSTLGAEARLNTGDNK